MNIDFISLTCTFIFVVGLTINSPPTSYKVILYGVIGDCPAIKLILNMVGHTSYYCCFYCYTKCIHSKEARIRQYPYSLRTQQRTKDSFLINSKVQTMQNSSKIFFSFIYIWLDRVRRAE